MNIIKARPLDYIIFGILGALQVQIIGYMSIIEVFFLFLGPYLLFTKKNEIINSPIKPYVILIILWIFGVIISDYTNKSDPILFLKGIAMPIFWLNAFICMYFIFNNRLSLIKWYFLGTSIGLIISIYIFKGGTYELAESLGEPLEGFMFYIGIIWVLLLTFLLFYSKSNPGYLKIIIFIFGLACFSWGSRSAGALSLLVFFLLILRDLYKDKKSNKISRSKIIQILIFTPIFIFSISTGYKYAAQNGILGEEAEIKYDIQSEGAIGLLSGRYEFIAAYYAILDSPIYGHGSSAPDKTGYAVMASEDLNLLIVQSYLEASQFSIPTHSHLWAGWVYNGILGLFIWVYLLVKILKFLVNSMQYGGRELPFLLLLSSMEAWNILASPIPVRTPPVAFYIIIICMANNLIVKKTYI